MELPKYIVIGEALEETVAHRVRFNGFRRCLMVTSKTPLKVFGEKILSALDGDISCEVCFVDEVVENFDRYVSGARSFDVVLGVGGGRVADVSKPLAEYSGKQFFSIPTVCLARRHSKPNVLLQTQRFGLLPEIGDAIRGLRRHECDFASSA
jgi:glycerol dehydrogenase-like iron-containing ADH family enzyme